MEMKERQRWRSEEDAILLSYVHQHGPRDWHLISHRMNAPLHRDAKSCLERWKNYLKPGLKKGSLTPDEQRLVIALQRKYGNKWKKIASLVPGRTAKRLGKWWEVFKDKQHREDQLKLKHASRSDPIHIQPSVKYDRILESFAEKLMQNSDPPIVVPDPPISVALTLAPAPIGEFGGWWKEVEEGYGLWAAERKEAAWRVRRVELQLEAEREVKKREKREEIERMIKELEEEKKRELERIEIECTETMRKMRTEAEAMEMRLMETWRDRHVRLRKVVDRMTVMKGGGIGR